MTGVGGTAGIGILMVMAAAGLWATVGVATQIVPEAAGIPPDVMGLARMAVAGRLLLTSALVIHDRSTLQASRLNVAHLVQFALSGALFQICLFRCFRLLGITLAVFITVCLPPVLAMLWTLQRGTTAPTRGTLVAFALALAGLSAISVTAAQDGSTGVGPQGLAYAVVASIAFVSMTFATRSLAASAPSIVIAGAGLLASGAVLLAVLALATPGSLSAAATALEDPRLMALLAYLGVGPTALAYLCYCGGIARCNSTCAGLIASMVEPAIAAFLAAWLLGERLAPATGVGCGLMMLAMTVLWWSSAPAPTRPDRPAPRTSPGSA